MTTPFRKIVGLNGVARNEYRSAQKMGRFFEWLMFFIAICLPFFWFMASKGVITTDLILLFHWFIWFAFTAELITLTTLVKRKTYYLKTNWLNMVIIVITFPLFWLHLPFVVAIRGLRFLLMFRVLVPWWGRLVDILTRNHLFYTLLAFTVIVLFGGALISLFDPGIKNPFDGIWWAVQTITTVGYGDIIPVSRAGRLFAVLIMVMGVALITILTANFSAYLLGYKENFGKKQQELIEAIKVIDEKIEKLDRRVHKLQKALKERDME